MSDAPSNSSASPVDRKRVGKCARLPKAIRDELNQRLQNGAIYRELADWLNTHPDRDTWENLRKAGLTGPFNEENISAWQSGGHQDWLRAQRRTDEIKARSEASLAMVTALREQGDGTLHITEANELILASQINEALSEFEPDSLKQLLRDKPAKFFDLANSIASQSNERIKREKLELEFRKYRDLVEETKAKLLAATSAAKHEGGLSAETLREIEEAAALL